MPITNSNPITPDQVIKAFGIGGSGNCASISVNKLALFQFGYEQACSLSTPLADGFSFRLRDGKTIAFGTCTL